MTKTSGSAERYFDFEVLELKLSPTASNRILRNIKGDLIK